MKALYDVPAPAKLNLFLHIIGRRADGYHLLQSVFVPIDWCDLLHFERRADAIITRHDLGAALPADDLCLRAARALQTASGTSLGADISIQKNVPWGAGMGGGSSDAASTLLALNRLWGLHWPRARLTALGATLGADVPFFLGDGPAWVEGIGEQLTPLQLASERFFVVKPAASLPTKEIFGSPLLARDTRPAIVMDFLAQQNGFGKNDMQAAAQALCAQVAEAAKLLHSRFGNSRMTGSGSAVFARLDARHVIDGNGVPKDLNFSDLQLPEGWIGRQCRSLESHPLKGWATD
ncbi:4-(cytidine 5'-diphospho)-2-C-methyl-D-erythritol kinase [Aquabacterium sp. A7-Y]|uniref:4-(cytidine 5'-diphospho)-2-C-methyl-D-erythritol kinase n=1 Tax=Aquabacterium sp. A7-Y TaxID=1349605 RepID=UPI00223D3FA0|nr:4-(cytidine 5'-diphospho)-2-C-methyl-D-erythritol kinase [Aquabacterium sp. A7-Y]MCW7537483.1 4-(cytidine 5'-diphospho)-2-C-methyl-D-erythritol kinase [Aquabacterium sp. A7-Y]